MALGIQDAGSPSSAIIPRPRATGRAEPLKGTSTRSGTRRWLRTYVTALVVVETAAAVVAGGSVLLAHPEALTPGSSLLAASLALVVAWPLLLHVMGSHDGQVLGAGSEEYRRVGRSAVVVLGVAGFLSYAADLDLSRGLVVIAIPGLAAATLLARAAARAYLHRLRAAGRCAKRVLVVGRSRAVLELSTQLTRSVVAGLDVVAACVTSEHHRVAESIGVPVGDLDQVVELAERVGADAIAVTSASETAAEYLRRLSWQLEGRGIELLVAPGLIEVAGPRLHIRPFEGFPLLAVEQPRFDGWTIAVKSCVDRVLAAMALVLVAPVFLAIAVAIRLSGPGPVFYRQERVGLNGQPFTMIKFRSMVVGADRQVEELRAANISDGLLFKMRTDPRVTPVGRWLRRLSLDELPQLFNVLGGSMSLVGPRPPLPAEVARYDGSVTRRLLVKPGLTGLWQISGRSDLSWEESVRLDLRYVENWSLATDLLIVCKTVRAVLSRSGAY